MDSDRFDEVLSDLGMTKEEVFALDQDGVRKLARNYARKLEEKDKGWYGGLSAMDVRLGFLDAMAQAIAKEKITPDAAAWITARAAHMCKKYEADRLEEN